MNLEEDDRRSLIRVVIGAAIALAIIWGVHMERSDGLLQRPAQPASTSDRMCDPRPPDYPGCTVQQVREREAGTKPKVNRHYNRGRWGQSHHEYRRLSRRADHKLGRAYGRAVKRYVRRQHMLGKTALAAQPAHMTWGGFKQATGCFGTFGGFPVGWCWFDRAVNTKIIDGVHAATLDCGGITFGATVGGIATEAARVEAEAVEVGALGPYAAGGEAGCVGLNLWKMIF
jgi:hypothetical protein